VQKWNGGKKYMKNAQLLVQDWMRTEVITVNPELHVERAWELMERQRVHHLPVVKNGQLLGIVTQGDLKRAVSDPAVGARATRRESAAGAATG